MENIPARCDFMSLHAASAVSVAAYWGSSPCIPAASPLQSGLLYFPAFFKAPFWHLENQTCKWAYHLRSFFVLVAFVFLQKLFYVAVKV